MPGGSLRGAVRGLRLWRRALSRAEVQGATCGEQGLVADVGFHEGRGSTVENAVRAAGWACESRVGIDQCAGKEAVGGYGVS